MMVALSLRRRIALWLCPELLAMPKAPVVVAPDAGPGQVSEVSQVSEASIVRLIEALGSHRGWKPTYAARMASGSGDTLQRIAGGVGLTIRRANAIIARCDELWPEGAPWPSDIPRPIRSPEVRP